MNADTEIALKQIIDEVFTLLGDDLFLEHPLFSNQTNTGIRTANILSNLSRVWLGTMVYKEYLQTEYWQEFRSKTVERSGYKCQLCNAENCRLDVHHKTYKRRGHELPEDVIVLCGACHAKFHGKLAS